MSRKRREEIIANMGQPEEKSLGQLVDEELERESRQKKKAFWGSFRRHMVKPMIVLSLLFFLVLAANYFFHLEVLSVNGSTHYTEEEFRGELVTNLLEENALFLYLEYRFFRNPDIPFVQKMDIEMLDGHELLVTVYEKTYIACVKYMNEYLYFDKDGIVVESAPKLIENVPVIEGVNFTKMTLYQKMEVEDDTVFRTILDLTQLIEQYKITIKKLVFNSKGEVTLYSGRVQVLLGARKDYSAQMAALSQILPKAKKKSLSGVINMEDYTEGQERVVFSE